MSAVAVANGLDKLDAPPLTQSDAVASLLSLSFSEGGLAPRDATAAVAPKVEPAPHQPPLAPAPSTSVPLSSSLSNGGKHHRRLSSTGKTRRRLSDAREAANRPSPSLLSSTSGLASLSLSSSPPPGSYPAHLSSSFTGASRKLAPAPPNPTNSSNHGSSGGNPGSIPIKSGEEETNDTGAIPIPSASIGYSRDNWGSYSHGSHQAYAGGVSLPNSSVRSASSPPPSPSRSRSGSLEDRSARQRRLSDDSPPSDDGVFDEMDGIEDDRHSARGIRIVGDRERYGHRSTRSYDSFTGRYGRGYGAGSYGRRLVKRDEDDDFDYAVREEDEDMDNMDGVGRLRKPPLQKMEEQWDGMDMDMDMD